jgi:hypothetical protein
MLLTVDVVRTRPSLSSDIDTKCPYKSDLEILSVYISYADEIHVCVCIKVTKDLQNLLTY